ncbi:hypothetical protein P389DRAFT_211324 [Cystobasidium minutum MCA 4210]|uniref:uncharacterized protein n=1 Tax=Cystobasidium minutum MCA 4210 TaxID=1397322 RepID=UPI0034CDD54F|eukprot:jgi/Rhomi1/211324/estExt_Genemark1.C_4_t20487
MFLDWTDEDEQAARILFNMRYSASTSPFNPPMSQGVHSSHMAQEGESKSDEMLASVEKQAEFEAEDVDEYHAEQVHHDEARMEEQGRGSYLHVKEESESPHFIPHSPQSTNFPTQSPIYAPHSSIQDSSVSPAYMMRSPSVNPAPPTTDPRYSPAEMEEFMAWKRMKQRKKEEEERDADVPHLDLDAEEARAPPMAVDHNEDFSHAHQDGMEDDSHQEAHAVEVKMEQEEDHADIASRASNFRTPHQAVIPPPPTPSQYRPAHHRRSASPFTATPERRVTRAMARTRSLSAVTDDPSPSPLLLKGVQSKLSQELTAEDEDKVGKQAEDELHQSGAPATFETPAAKIEEAATTATLKRPLPEKKPHPRLLQRIRQERSMTIAEEPDEDPAEAEKTLHEATAAVSREKCETETKLEEAEKPQARQSYSTSPVRKPILASNSPSPVKLASGSTSEASVKENTQDLSSGKAAKSAQSQALEELKDRKGEPLFFPRSSSSEPAQKPVIPNLVAMKKEVEDLLQSTRY